MQLTIAGEGATVRAATLRESCCLVIFKIRKVERPSRTYYGEGNIPRGEPVDNAGLFRGMGSGTNGRSAMELERPYWMVHQGESGV